MLAILFSIMPDNERDFVNKLFSKMNIKMYNISFNILRDKFDAEEAVAQTFLKIIDNIERISALPCPQIEPYCVIILKNETMNIIRKRKKVIHVENVDHFDHKDEAYDIEEEYLQALNKEKLLTCINRLSDEDKTLIHLRFANEMGFKHIADLLGITEEAAKKRGQRILKKLRQFYEGSDEDAKDS
ncbi:MAG: sigma-70 family RNA polymerase sigma factor [Epulopiscium sp.]|nr:sigma-70 family RNA polymerase sigma factor [Candidatus Epulonipiscium sp.]